MVSRLSWIALGTNQGDSIPLYRRAVDRLRSHPSGIRLIKCSSLYLTEPVGSVRQPWFVNGVVMVESPWGPVSLLRRLHRIESSFGRNRRREVRWGPRRLDLDLLFHDDRVISSKNIQLPHPELHKRRFVLTPLAEISPQLVHPIIGKTVDRLLQCVDDTATVKRLTE
ncbi:MAG: 2-amino-4-hydroxy-6-hydroxymethyldihydropteridine diphosphokinase [Magnetococcales bacterium]|nr:2-amino-4-hydroxy-6-hydroxymethyldihydropteridine diphosphokinase [Magnetococcales bacterium]